jgi:hypothetical protein
MPAYQNLHHVGHAAVLASGGLAYRILEGRVDAQVER